MSESSFRYLLDTNIISDMVRNPAGRAVARLKQVDPLQVCTSIIVVCEIRFGTARRNSQRLTNQVETVLSGIPILPLETPADSFYGDLRDKLARGGKPIGYNDLFIAAHALALDLTLVTANVGEFSRVPNLQVENWLTQSA